MANIAALTFASNRLFSTHRIIEAGGKEWLVVNGVPLVEGVLNGRFVSADEFGVFTNDWNDVPVVLRHPKANGGSARVPSTDVPVVGRFYNAKIDHDGKRLIGEYWLDKNLLENSEEGKQLLDLISNDRPIETSTGYWSESHPSVGKFNGRDYGLVDRNIHPDHIALLPDEVGACSLADGCGLNRNCAESTRENPWGCPCNGGVSQNHGGPGPHKDGSSQDVHGGGRKGSGARDGTTRREKISASLSAIFRDDGSVEIWNEYPPSGSKPGGANLKARLDRGMMDILSRANHPSNELIRLNPSYSAIFRDDGSVEVWNVYGPSDSKPGGANRMAKIDRDVFGRLIGSGNKKNAELAQNVTGSLPAEGKTIWESVYEKSKEKYGDERAAQIAWGAVKRAGWVQKDGEWMKANHGGPGPHKDGSSQDVHGKKGAGASTTSTPGKGRSLKKRIKNHPMWSESDYDYLSGKGYSDSEILAFWDRDHDMGKGPVEHKPIPDLVSRLAGNPEDYDEAVLDYYNRYGRMPPSVKQKRNSKQNQQDDLELLAVALLLLDS